MDQATELRRAATQPGRGQRSASEREHQFHQGGGRSRECSGVGGTVRDRVCATTPATSQPSDAVVVAAPVIESNRPGGRLNGNAGASPGDPRRRRRRRVRRPRASCAGAELRRAQHLTGPSGRQVVDRTGLDGRWEFVLHFSRLERDPNAPLGLYPSLFTSLQSELGLKLVPFVGKNKLLVIDHIERPTEN
jgi:uncharacterized protein (TIGR03435 family)